MPAVLAAVITILGAGHAASAAPRPHITDPAGDVLTREPAYDVTAVTFDSEGKLVGSRFVPTHLVVRMNLVAPPSMAVGHNYQATGEIGQCRLTLWVYFFGDIRTPNGGWQVGCSALGPDYWPVGKVTWTTNLPPRIVGRSLVWRLAYKYIPDPARPGALLTRLRAFTSVNDPILGPNPGDYNPRLSLDYAESERTYRLGSRSGR